jgi:hypothetical protein
MKKIRIFGALIRKIALKSFKIKKDSSNIDKFNNYILKINILTKTIIINSIKEYKVNRLNKINLKI